MGNREKTICYLRDTAEFFERNPDIWGRGDYLTRDDAGEIVQICVMGALGLVAEDNPYFFEDVTNDTNEALTGAERALYGTITQNLNVYNSPSSVQSWNDVAAADVNEIISTLNSTADDLEDSVVPYH